MYFCKGETEMIPLNIERNPHISPLAKCIFMIIFTHYTINSTPCTLKNSNFAEYFNKSKITISQAITALKKDNLINVTVIRHHYKNGKNCWQHQITLTNFVKHKFLQKE